MCSGLPHLGILGTPCGAGGGADCNMGFVADVCTAECAAAADKSFDPAAGDELCGELLALLERFVGGEIVFAAIALIDPDAEEVFSVELRALLDLLVGSYSEIKNTGS